MMDRPIFAIKNEEGLARHYLPVNMDMIYGDGEEFLPYFSIKIYTALEDMEDFYELDKSSVEDLIKKKKIIEICHLSGTIILVNSAIRENFDPYEVCDASSGELEYVYSILMEKKLVFDKKSSEHRDNLSIDQIEWASEFDDVDKKSVVDLFRYFITSLYHVTPGILCYYTAPIESYERVAKEISPQISAIMHEKISSFMGEESEEDDNVLPFSEYFSIPEKDLNDVMGKRNQGDSFPQEYLDQKEYDLFLALGFNEIEDTRLMVRITDTK